MWLFFNCECHSQGHLVSWHTSRGMLPCITTRQEGHLFVIYQRTKSFTLWSHRILPTSLRSYETTTKFYSNDFDKGRLLASISHRPGAQETPVWGWSCIEKETSFTFSQNRKQFWCFFWLLHQINDELSSTANRLTKILVCGSSVIAGGKSLAGKSKIIHNVTLHQPDCYWAR